MTLSMYQASVPVFLQLLPALSGVLDKAAAHAEQRRIPPANILATRLYPDMLPLARQIQLASDHAKGAGARLAGLEVPSFPDTETDFAQLAGRIARTIDFLKSLKPAQIDGSEARDIKVPVGPQTVAFQGQAYLLHFAMPNFYFHLTIAYAILRHCGVEIGKRDFIGALITA